MEKFCTQDAQDDASEGDGDVDGNPKPEPPLCIRIDLGAENLGDRIKLFLAQISDSLGDPLLLQQLLHEILPCLNLRFDIRNDGGRVAETVRQPLNAGLQVFGLSGRGAHQLDEH